MAFYRSREWERLLVDVDEWWLAACEFINTEGEELPPRGWDGQTTRIIDGCRALASIDPMPFWDVARLIKTWQTTRNPIRAPLADVQSAVERVWGLEMELRRLGVVEEQSAGKPMLTDKQQQALDFIRSKKEPVKGLLVWRHIEVNESTFRRHYVKILKSHGVKSGRDGYYLAR